MALPDFSFLEFAETYDSDELGVWFGRQMSEPATMGRSSAMQDEPIKVNPRKRPAAKKTCFDLSFEDVNEEDLAIHRQMSEPVKVYMSCGLSSKGTKKAHEDCSSGSDGESQATTSPSTASSCSNPGGAFSACTSMKSTSHDEAAPGSPRSSPAGALGLLDLPPGLAVPPGLNVAEASAKKKDDSEMPQKVPTPFCKSLSAAAPEFVPGGGEEAAAVPNTLMVSNLAEQYTRELLIVELQDSGFCEGRDFDYLSVPMVGPSTNKGVCFINFMNSGLRHAFVAAFEGRELRYGAGRPVQVKPCKPSDMAAQPIIPAASPETRRAKFCPQCGGSIQGTYNFCTQCGNSLKNLP